MPCDFSFLSEGQRATEPESLALPLPVKVATAAVGWCVLKEIPRTLDGRIESIEERWAPDGLASPAP